MDQDTYFVKKDDVDPLALKKIEVDYSPQCDVKIPEAESLAESGNLQGALDVLYNLERMARTGSDTHSLSRLLVAIVRICKKSNDWNVLCENIALICKKRGQLRQSVTKMIQEAFVYTKDAPNKETLMKFLDTMLSVTAGKIYVENERARLTKMLSDIKEAEGKIEESAKLMQDLQVETFGSMDKREKVDFLLEQMRLCMANSDYIQTQMISRKISLKYFNEEGTEDLKLRFYKLMIELDCHEERWLNVSKHYNAVWKCKSILEDVNKWSDAMSSVILFLFIAPFDNEQQDLLHRLREEKALHPDSILPRHAFLIDLIKRFVANEIFNFSEYEEQFTRELTGSIALADQPERMVLLRRRVSEHNVRVIAKYYTKIHLARMATLLRLNQDDTEKYISDLVQNGQIHAKLDRLDGVVVFARPETSNDLLNEWSYNLSDLMRYVSKATHLIEKEQMINQLKA